MTRLWPLLGLSQFDHRQPPIETLKSVVKFGFKAVQLVGDFSVNFPESVSPADRHEFAYFLRDNNLRLHYHAPHDLLLASRHPQIRRGGLDRAKEFIELAVEMGAISFTIHPARFATFKITTGRIDMTTKGIPISYIEWFYESLHQLMEFGNDAIFVLLENTQAYTEQMTKYIDAFLQLPNSGLAWDTAHTLNLSPFERQAMAEFITARLRKIKLFHLHDANSYRGHLPLGSGKVDLAAWLHIIEDLGVDAIIEVFTEADLNRSLAFLKSMETWQSAT